MKNAFSVICLLFLVSCQFQVPSPTASPPSPVPATASPVPASPTPQPSPSPSPTSVPSTPTPILFNSPIAQPFAAVRLQQSSLGDYPQTLDQLPLDAKKIGNLEVTGGLTGNQRYFLLQNGFVVIPSGDEHFKFIRRNVSTVDGQPYYLTTDAAYHALHVTFNDLLQALESEVLLPEMTSLVQALYDQTSAYAEQAVGSDIAADALLARDYTALALKLFNPAQNLDPAVEQRLAPQLAQIDQEGGKQTSLLIPYFTDDYGAYRPAGHYSASPRLQAYFRGMTWLGRVTFKLKDGEETAFQPSRASLILTLALRDASVGGRPAREVWSEVTQLLDFLIGPSDDPGPVELNALINQIYGPAASQADLADPARWQAFLARADDLPAPQIHSTFAQSLRGQNEQRGWRLMGQRFTLDGLIFQQLIADNVKNRNVPNGLDLAAAFGSPTALNALEAAGETKYENYTAQLEKVQAALQSQPEPEWLNRFYSAWFYAFLPQLAPKDSRYPPLMRSQAWAYKDINTALGSWAELKHDTVLYARMPETQSDGGPPSSGPAPGYVEPNPDVFFRLAYAAQSLCQGLGQHGADQKAQGDPDNAFPFSAHYNQLCQLSTQLEQFGEIALKELRGETLTSADYGTIQSCLELKECLDRGEYSLNAPEPDPLPAVSAVAGFNDQVLEAGTGFLNRIYVAVPLEGKLEIAQGGVFSYYEFQQPRSQSLTDESWRERLASAPPPGPFWQRNFLLPYGKPFNVLAFRIGDIYQIGPKGYNPPLNLRSDPSRGSEVLTQLDQGYYFEIIAGPVLNEGERWWKIRSAANSDNFPEGWILENQEWYTRSHH